jgi:ketosteroid isomerase-like protein
MRRWIVRLLVTRAYTAMGEGDPEPVLRMFTPTTRFRFAGAHSWAIDSDEPQQIRGWFERFAAFHLELRVVDVVVNGPPWNMSVCVVLDDVLRDATGQVIYQNHGVQYLRLRWGKVVVDEVNVDTQRVAQFDAQLLNR